MGEWISYTRNLPEEEINEKKITGIAGFLLCADNVHWERNWPATSTMTVIHNISDSHIVQWPAVMIDFMKLLIVQRLIHWIFQRPQIFVEGWFHGVCYEGNWFTQTIQSTTKAVRQTAGGRHELQYQGVILPEC